MGTTGKPKTPTPDATAHPFKIRRDVRYLVQNRTPKRIKVTAGTDTMDLAPLAERLVSGARLTPFEQLLIPLRQAHQVALRPYVPASRAVRTVLLRQS